MSGHSPIVESALAGLAIPRGPRCGIHGDLLIDRCRRCGRQVRYVDGIAVHVELDGTAVLLPHRPEPAHRCLRCDTAEMLRTARPCNGEPTS